MQPSKSTGLPQDLLPLCEAARLLPGIRPGKRLNVATLWRWCRTGKIPAWRIGRSWFVSRADVLAMPRPEVPPRPAVVRTEGYAAAVEYLRSVGVRA